MQKKFEGASVNELSGQVFKYIKIANILRNEIIKKNYLFGDKLPSEKSLCDEYSVSRETVRKAFSVLQSGNYVKPIKGSGTYVTYNKNEEDAEKSSMTIGVISTYFDDYIFPPIIRGMNRILSENGYSLQLFTTDNIIEKETIALNKLHSLNIDGIIAEPTKSGFINPNIYLYKKFIDEKIPVIFFNSYYPELREIPYVSLDDREAGKLATNILFKNNHRNIVSIMKRDDLQGQLRYKGFLDVLFENNIDINIDKHIWYTTEDLRNIENIFEKELMRFIGDATAIFCYNDLIAYKAIDFLLSAGIRVPEDISIISVDNLSFAKYHHFPIASINHPKSLLGQKVAENILEMIRKKTVGSDFLFPAEFVSGRTIRFNK
ncbi:MAG: substrate-binding domain-containing protein [Clostridiaceae bacterium]|nr:substrate-binding domain-containing protein [Clostridiaceae bacterium]